MPETEDLYEILQVHPTAHPDVIQAAYRRLALLYHPDKNPSQEAAGMMKRLNLAYETLSDPNRRAAYDRTRGAQQRQRAETGSRATHRERPRTSSTTNEPTSQSRAGTPTAPPEARSSKAFRITAGLLGGSVVVGAIIVAAVIASAGRGDGDGEGARSVAFSPTRTPIPVKATPVPTSGGTTGMGLVAPTARPTRSPTPDLATMVERVKPGVVRIETPDGGGTGFIFETGTRRGALVLTNYHVIKGLDRVNVQVNDSRTYQGKVVGYDTVRDLAVLEICCGEFQALNLNGAENIKPGNEVVAIGYPLWLRGSATVTRGIVSAVGYDTEHKSRVLQTDAPFSPGNSGGPLLSASGEVVGIVSFGMDRTEADISTEGLGFAISGRTVREVLPELKREIISAAVPPTGIPSPTPGNASTPTPRPTMAPSPRPTATLGPTPAPLLTPTAVATPVPAPTHLPAPTLAPTSTPQPTRGDYFTRGSSQDDVLHVQGAPTEINTYAVLGHEDWYYGYSTVRFSLPDGRVSEWDDDGNLKVRLLPRTSESSTPGYFTRGSSQDDVLHVQGAPTEINTYAVLGHEDWYYGYSTVRFSLPDGRVSEWDDDGNLKVRLLPKTSESSTPGYFTRGSSQDDVLHVQGAPTEINTYAVLGHEDWYYGYSTVRFSLPDGRVSEWDDDGNLKVRLLPRTSESSTPGYFTRGSSQDDVLHVQGAPTEINTYAVSGYEDWYYGYSTVRFSLPGGRVTEWDNNDGNLKVRLLPRTSESSTPGYFTRDSSQDDVLHVQGTPTEINTYAVSGYEDWYYGYSTVRFSLPDKRVTEWDNEGDLKVR